MSFFQPKGYIVGLNTPFSGSIVPLNQYRTDPRVNSFMIEINRALYMDGSSGSKSEGFMQVRENISDAVSMIRAYQ